MRFTSLLDCARRAVGYRVRGVSRVPWGRRRLLPFVEGLEGRILPTTFTVLNLADSGPGSLRQAVLAAEANSGPDVIAFDPAVKGTITLTSGQIPITTDLAINGPGANQLTVSGNDASRIFFVVGGSDASTAITVSISGLTLSHGYALGSGGAIRNRLFSDLTVSGVVLANNKAVPAGAHFSSFGGAIANTGNGAVLSVRDSALANNTVDASTGAAGNGGAVYSSGDSATLTNTMISGNQSLAAPGFTGFGGGVEVVRGSLTVNNSLITTNRVVSGAGPTSDGVYTFALGGGIEVIDANTTATISNSTIAANESVGGPGGGVADGGGIDVRASGPGVTITNCLITGNRAVGGAGGGHANGGGLLDAGSNVTVSGCTFLGNQAVGPDGGFDGQAIGGAIANYFLGSMLSISDSTFVGNQAIAGNGAVLNVTGFFGDVAEGGAISNQYEASLAVSRCTFNDNQSIGGNHAVATADTPFAGGGEGGALYNALGSTAVIRDSVIEHNQAIGGNGNSAAGASTDWNPPFVGYAAGGGISNNYDDSVDGFGPPQLTLINTTIDHNEAIGGNGNTANGAMAFVGDAMGGGIANYLGATANIQNSAIAHNQAVGGQGNVSTGGAAPANMGTGGGIFSALGNFNSDGLILAPSIVTMTNSTLTNNQAVGGQAANGTGGQAANGTGGDGRGGGLADFFTATSNILSSTLANNLALGGAPGSGASGGNGWGGGVFNDAYSSLTLTSSIVTMNHANGDNGGTGIGGGIYNLGLLNFDVFTVIRKNHASTGYDDIFG